MMSEGFLLPFFLFLGVLLFFLSGNRKKKQISPPLQKTKVVRQAPPLGPNTSIKPVIPKKAERLVAAVYEVEKKKTTSFLHEKWQDKDALKQAFILSEVLKRLDEKEPF